LDGLTSALDDAISFSISLKSEGLPAGGGADGSIIIFSNIEANFHENIGILDSIDLLTPFLASHPQVSPGDLIQFATAVGISNCPGAPRLEFLLGRPNATAPSPDGLIPEPQDSVDQIFDRMDDAANFTPQEVVALLAAHTIARANHIDPAITAVPFDTTPFTFDTQIFLEVLLEGIGFPGTANNTGKMLPYNS
jgi:manganese peroxidase